MVQIMKLICSSSPISFVAGFQPEANCSGRLPWHLASRQTACIRRVCLVDRLTSTCVSRLMHVDLRCAELGFGLFGRQYWLRDTELRCCLVPCMS
jgi:hypothetical protein